MKMKPTELTELQNLCKVMVHLKKQLVEELPHYGNESLFFHNDEITTGLLNNKLEIKLHLLEKKFLFFDNENGFFIDVRENEISKKLENIIKNYKLTLPEIPLDSISEKAMIDFYEFAFNANEVLELFRMRLENKFTLVHLWPHHFDFSLEWFTGKNDEQIGIGISPGDEQYEDPYLYMNPWPFNKNIIEERLLLGNWHTDSWNGIKVEFEDLIKLGSKKASNDLFKLFEICKRNFVN